MFIDLECLSVLHSFRSAMFIERNPETPPAPFGRAAKRSCLASHGLPLFRTEQKKKRRMAINMSLLRSDTKITSRQAQTLRRRKTN